MSKLKESYDDYLFNIFRKCEEDSQHMELLVCRGCANLFTVDPEDSRATPDLDPELIYCDTCNEEARQWCERVEANW